MIVVPDRGLIAGQVADGGGQPAFELVVVVGIEQIVFAVVLVVDDCLHVAETAFEQAVFGGPVRACAIGIAAPGDIGAGQIGIGVPAAFVDQRLQPRAVGAGLGAEHPVPGTAQRRVCIDAVGDQCGGIRAHPRGQRIHIVGLLHRGDGADGGIEQVDLGGERIAEKTGQAQASHRRAAGRARRAA